MQGKGLSLSLNRCEVDICNNAVEIQELIDNVIELLEMQKLGKLHTMQGAKHLPGKSAIQMIETSHVACHCFSNTISYLFSIESCKKFNVNKVKKYLKDYLKPKLFKINSTYIVEVDT